MISRISQPEGRPNRRAIPAGRNQARPPTGRRKKQSREENYMFQNIMIPSDGSDLAAKDVKQGVLFVKEIGTRLPP